MTEETERERKGEDKNKNKKKDRTRQDKIEKDMYEVSLVGLHSNLTLNVL